MCVRAQLHFQINETHEKTELDFQEFNLKLINDNFFQWLCCMIIVLFVGMSRPTAHLNYFQSSLHVA